jgi:DNA-binding MarR family transcriptional regulator
MRPVLLRHGLSTAEFDVLATLRNAPAPHEMTPSQIQREMVITSGGLTKLMLQLAGRGLVERSSFEDDRRVKPLRLTAIGRQAVEAAMVEMLAASGQWIRAALTSGEIAQLTQLLDRLVAAPERGEPPA